MRTIKWLLALSILINVCLFAYISIKNKGHNEAFERMTNLIMGDLVSLEGAITYQYENNWSDENIVIEKIEDILKETHFAINMGKRSGVLTNQIEEDLFLLIRYLNRYPEYTGFPNTELEEKDREQLMKLRDSLRQAGWGMNMSYGAGWESFHEAVYKLWEAG